MTTPNRDQIIRAYEALERLERAAWKGSENEYEEMYHSEAKDIILSILPPKPPTMDEIEWDDDKHFLAEAEQVSRGHVIMVEVVDTGEIRCMSKGLGNVTFFLVRPETLTPTGYRYTLEEL